MADKKIGFYPFAALNGFMVDDYREKIIREVLTNLDRLSGERRGTINSLINRFVSVPGFRNSSLAPLPLRIKGIVKSFESQSNLVSQLLMAWSELHLDLRQQVYELLQSRSWEVLPPETDRTKLPGFLIRWPEEENYDTLGKAFSEKFPQLEVNEDDLRLMTVWISGSLPYQEDEHQD